jgi:hypothetical protein
MFAGSVKDSRIMNMREPNRGRLDIVAMRLLSQTSKKGLLEDYWGLLNTIRLWNQTFGGKTTLLKQKHEKEQI